MRKLILACKKIHRQAMQGWKCDAVSWNAWRAMLLLTHCSATPHGPRWWLKLQPLHLHSRQKDGGRDKERVTDSGQLSFKETSKKPVYNTPIFRAQKKPHQKGRLVVILGLLLLWNKWDSKQFQPHPQTFNHSELVTICPQIVHPIFARPLFLSGIF